MRPAWIIIQFSIIWPSTSTFCAQWDITPCGPWLRYLEAPVCCPGPGAPPLRVTKYGSDGPSLARGVLRYWHQWCTFFSLILYSTDTWGLAREARVPGSGLVCFDGWYCGAALSFSNHSVCFGKIFSINNNCDWRRTMPHHSISHRGLKVLIFH